MRVDSFHSTKEDVTEFSIIRFDYTIVDICPLFILITLRLSLLKDKQIEWLRLYQG